MIRLTGVSSSHSHTHSFSWYLPLSRQQTLSLSLSLSLSHCNAIESLSLSLPRSEWNEPNVNCDNIIFLLKLLLVLVLEWPQCHSYRVESNTNDRERARVCVLRVAGWGGYVVGLRERELGVQHLRFHLMVSSQLFLLRASLNFARLDRFTEPGQKFL